MFVIVLGILGGGLIFRWFWTTENRAPFGAIIPILFIPFVMGASYLHYRVQTDIDYRKVKYKQEIKWLGRSVRVDITQIKRTITKDAQSISFSVFAKLHFDNISNADKFVNADCLDARFPQNSNPQINEYFGEYSTWYLSGTNVPVEKYLRKPFKFKWRFSGEESADEIFNMDFAESGISIEENCPLFLGEENVAFWKDGWKLEDHVQPLQHDSSL